MANSIHGNDGIHNTQTRHFYDIAPLEKELFDVVKKYDLPYELLDSALIEVRQGVIEYFNEKHKKV